jgi:GTPase SAR1 family protein
MKWIKLFEDYQNKYKTIVIFGLPGSGKTSLANKIKKENSEMDYVIYDDYEWMKGESKFGKENQIISDGFLMNYPDRKKEDLIKMANDKGVEVEFLYFENDPQKSLANAKKRWEKGDATAFQGIESIERSIKDFSRSYNVPKDVNALPIWTH